MLIFTTLSWNVCSDCKQNWYFDIPILLPYFKKNNRIQHWFFLCGSTRSPLTSKGTRSHIHTLTLTYSRKHRLLMSGYALLVLPTMLATKAPTSCLFIPPFQLGHHHPSLSLHTVSKLCHFVCSLLQLLPRQQLNSRSHIYLKMMTRLSKSVHQKNIEKSQNSELHIYML